MRSRDVSTLSGLQMVTGEDEFMNDEYISTDDREMAAWRASVAQQGIGDVMYDEEDIEALRGIL